MALHLEVVTPDGPVLAADPEYIGIPGAAGQFGVMSGHIPLLSALAVGSLYYRQGDSQTDLFVSGGFAEISNDKVMILAEAAERREDIDIERARKAKERAEARLAKARSGQGGEEINIARANAALTRAIMRLSIAGSR